MYRRKRLKQKYNSTTPKTNDSQKFPTLLLLIILSIIIAVGFVLYKTIATPSRVQSNFGYKFY
jgi:hypothetical protein